MIQVSAFRWVPPFAQGLVRDLRVRWALEEAGLDYEELLITPQDQKTESYRKLQPFGQVPALKQDGLELFESGAIVLHIAERSEALMPDDPTAREHARMWMFAALNSVEPPTMMLNIIDMQSDDKAKTAALRGKVLDFIKARLDVVSNVLAQRDYLGERFTAADLLMTTVLRNLRTTDLVAQRPTLETYRLRCEARPAFQRALADQLAVFAENEPAKTA